MASSSDPTKPKVLLSDEQVHSFIRDGFLVLNPTESELPASLHAELYKAAVDLANEARGRPNPHLTHFGDNLLARIPMISKVLSSPTVVGAVESVLGEKAVMHPHHFVHMATQNDQGWHQDENLPWNSRGNVRSHRTVAILVGYYPQDVTLELGPPKFCLERSTTTTRARTATTSTTTTVWTEDSL